MTGALILISIPLLMMAVGLPLARLEGKRRSLFCLGCDHSLLMHGGKRGHFCQAFLGPEWRCCRCKGLHDFVHRSELP